jgi:hypothetical protein
MSDGYLTANIVIMNSTVGNVSLKSSSSNPPDTKIQIGGNPGTSDRGYYGAEIYVKSGDYYSVISDGTIYSSTITFTPIL